MEPETPYPQENLWMRSPPQDTIIYLSSWGCQTSHPPRQHWSKTSRTPHVANNPASPQVKIVPLHPLPLTIIYGTALTSPYLVGPSLWCSEESDRRNMRRWNRGKMHFSGATEKIHSTAWVGGWAWCHDHMLSLLTAHVNILVYAFRTVIHSWQLYGWLGSYSSFTCDAEYCDHSSL